MNDKIKQAVNNEFDAANKFFESHPQAKDGASVIMTGVFTLVFAWVILWLVHWLF